MALVADGYETSALTAREKAVLRYVDTILTDPAGLTGAQRDELPQTPTGKVLRRAVRDDLAAGV